MHIGRHLNIQETKYFVYFVKAVEMYNGFALSFMSYSIAVDITIRVSNTTVKWYVRGMQVKNLYASINFDCDRTIRNVCSQVGHFIC